MFHLLPSTTTSFQDAKELAVMQNMPETFIAEMDKHLL
jgi:hypothetical protein